MSLSTIFKVSGSILAAGAVAAANPLTRTRRSHPAVKAMMAIRAIKDAGHRRRFLTDFKHPEHP